MKIAIVGTGISGNVAAFHLQKHHDVTVFEANSYTGGHTHTHQIEMSGSTYSIDTGFIVFNHRTYPHYLELLRELDVEEQPSAMSFSVKCDRSGLEYNGTTLNSLFAQRKNLFSPKFYRMIREILRFNREALALLEQKNDSLNLGDYLYQGKYSAEFIDHYIIPMGAAIWSADPVQMFDFPARFFIQFFHNHGMLSVNDRPQWYVIKGGSHEYVKRLTTPFRDRIRHNTPVRRINRFIDRIEIVTDDYGVETFDCVFIACHSDQALALLDEPSPAEQEVLSAIPYQENEAILHTDESLLPERRLAWAAWNYHLLKKQQDRVALTYNMNILQSLQADQTFCVTLNNTQAIDPAKIIKRITYHHPVFTPAGIQAQQRHSELNGNWRTFYCGAYWRNGFHEDGVVSALQALSDFQEFENNYVQSYLRRAS